MTTIMSEAYAKAAGHVSTYRNPTAIKRHVDRNALFEYPREGEDDVGDEGDAIRRHPDVLRAIDLLYKCMQRNSVVPIAILVACADEALRRMVPEWTSCPTRERMRRRWIDFMRSTCKHVLSKTRFFAAAFALTQCLTSSEQTSDYVSCVHLIRNYWESSESRRRFEEERSSDARRVGREDAKEDVPMDASTLRLTATSAFARSQKSRSERVRSVRSRAERTMRSQRETIRGGAVWHVSNSKLKRVQHNNSAHEKRTYAYDEDAFRDGFRTMMNDHFRIRTFPKTFDPKTSETIMDKRVRNKLRPHGTLLCTGRSREQSKKLLGLA